MDDQWIILICLKEAKEIAFPLLHFRIIRITLVARSVASFGQNNMDLKYTQNIYISFGVAVVVVRARLLDV